MFRNVKKIESNISVELEEPLTSHACSQLVIEIIKYIMYQKQQIPFSGDTLIKLFASTKPSDRNFSSMKKLINTLENVSSHLAEELSLDNCDVKEILIIIGATIVSPKLCIKLELPHILSKTHINREHPYRKPLMSVMKTILGCTEFQDELCTPLLPTNTFLLVQKRDLNKTSEFFILKPQFALSSKNMACLNVKLNYNEKQNSSCDCKDMQPQFSIWSGFSKARSSTEGYNDRESKQEHSVPYLWYQSKEVFKGFKFVK